MKWPTVKLKDVCELITDGVHNSPEYCSTGIPMLDSKHIGENFFIDDTKPEKFISPVTDAMLSTRCKPSTEDVLISSRGSIGKIAIVRRNQNFNIMGNIILIRAAKNITPKFLAYTLSNKVSHLISIANGVAQKGLYLNQIRSLEIPLPPLVEQKRIAEILDKAAEIKAKREQAIAKLDELSQSTFVEMFGDVNDLIAGGNTEQLSSVVANGKIITYGIVQAGPHIENGIPYIKTGDIKGGAIVGVDKLARTSKEIANSYARSAVAVNDIVMSIRATVGTTALVPASLDGANLTQGTARIAPGDTILPAYLLNYLRTSAVQRWIQKQVKGATFREITLGKLRELPVYVPSIERQKKYTNAIEKIEILKKYFELSQTVKMEMCTSLQHQAFTTGFNA